MEAYSSMLFIVISTVVILTGSWAADTAPPGVRVFALTFLQLDPSQTAYTYISVTGTGNGASRISVPFLNYSQYDLLRQSNSYKAQYLNTNDKFVNQAGGVSQQGVIVVTKDTSGVMGSSMVRASGDTFLGLPLTTKSKQYYIPTFPTMSTGDTSFAIASATTNCLEIYQVVNGAFKLRKSLNMEKGQIYQEYGTQTGDDLTGLYVTSSGPISVFGGHECAQIPEGTRYCDHMVEQIPAVEYWEKTAVVPPVGGRLSKTGYLVRILASQDTTITFPYNKGIILFDGANGCSCANQTASDCTSACTISKGGFIQVKVSDTLQPITVTCSVPCLVVQYSFSLETAEGEPLDPDPAMLVVTPTDHYVNQMSYQTPEYILRENGVNVLRSYTHFLTIISATSDNSGVLLDKELVNSTLLERLSVNGTQVVQGSYTVTTLSVDHGYHVIEHSDPTKKIMAFGYGHTPFVVGGTSSSYASPLGYETDGITPRGSWAEDIAIPAGVNDPDVIVTTAVPRECFKTPGNEMNYKFMLRGVDVSDKVDTCDAILTSDVLQNMTSKINHAICDRSICPSVTEDIYMTNLTTAVINGTLFLYAEMTVNMDAPIYTMVECRIHVVNYIERIDFWKELLPANVYTTCYNVLKTLTKISQTWSCESLSSSLL